MHLDETDIAKYFHLKRLNLPDRVIAEKHFHVSYASFNRWKRKYKIDPTRTTAEYLHLRALYYTDNEIAIIWGLSKSGLFMWKRRNNLPEEYFSYVNRKGGVK